jgi:urease accessory protein
MFAIFHGYAHGTEIPVDGTGVLFGIGFIMATASLHGLGIALGLAIRSFDELPRRRAMQACGAAIGLIGTGLTIGLV